MERSALSVAILRQRLVSLLAAMPAAQSGDEASVHQARVASRRLREALPVIGTSGNAHALDRVDRRVRRITRALGPVRELDVALLLLTELESRGAATPAAIGLVRAAVIEERHRHRHDMLAEITPSRLEKLRKRLAAVAAGEVDAPAANARAEASVQTGKRARRLKRAIDHAGGIYLAERLHQVRIAAMKLRYAIEIQRELTRSRSRLHLSRLKTQQNLLGRMHDLEMLIDRARAVQAAMPARNRRGMADVNALIRVLEDECREGHAAYMHARPAMLKLCDAVIDAAGQSRSSAA